MNELKKFIKKNKLLFEEKANLEKRILEIDIEIYQLILELLNEIIKRKEKN